MIQAFRWFLLLMPVFVLFYQENGLGLQDIFIIQAFYSICVILFEIPSGYFADILGRKRSMLIGVIFAALGFNSTPSHTRSRSSCSPSSCSPSDPALSQDLIPLSSTIL